MSTPNLLTFCRAVRGLSEALSCLAYRPPSVSLANQLVAPHAGSVFRAYSGPVYPYNNIFDTYGTEEGRQHKEPIKFMSLERRIHPTMPFKRHPICFPDIELFLIKLSTEDLEQIRATGWLREAVFRTTPNVTKLEIKAFLESVYGMSVERVHTINYLGTKRSVNTSHGRQLLFREDDWKKVYVLFNPPPGQELPQPRTPADERPVIDQLRDIMGAGPRDIMEEVIDEKALAAREAAKVEDTNPDKKEEPPPTKMVPKEGMRARRVRELRTRFDRPPSSKWGEPLKGGV